MILEFRLALANGTRRSYFELGMWTFCSRPSQIGVPQGQPDLVNSCRGQIRDRNCNRTDLIGLSGNPLACWNFRVHFKLVKQCISRAKGGPPESCVRRSDRNFLALNQRVIQVRRGPLPVTVEPAPEPTARGRVAAGCATAGWERSIGGFSNGQALRNAHRSLMDCRNSLQHPLCGSSS